MESLNNYFWLLAPLAIGLLIVITHVQFGQEVLRRGIVFIDLTLAQVAALGALIATLLGWGQTWQVQLFALAAALAVAFLLSSLEQQLQQRQEAVIGALYISFAALLLVLLHYEPHGQEVLKTILSGQLLWQSWQEFWPTLLIYSVLLLLWRTIGAKAFYPLFAVLVTSSVQLVGLYLVFASLVLPALASKNLFIATALGMLGYVLGFLLSLTLDWPAGPAIVLALGALSFGFSLANALKQRFR